jgi:hypothetical protein
MGDEDDRKKPEPRLFSTLEDYGKQPTSSLDDPDPHAEVSPQHLASVGPILGVMWWLNHSTEGEGDACGYWAGTVLIVLGLIATMALGGWRYRNRMVAWAVGGVVAGVIGWATGIAGVMWGGIIAAVVTGPIAVATMGIVKR